MKISVNDRCPCGSKIKYKQCCQKYHKGAKAENALVLMKSRYTAYLLGNATYIIKTTHPQNPDYEEDHHAWRAKIKAFSRENKFLNLKIESFLEEKELAYVTFVATLENGKLREKSTFAKISGEWRYLSAEFKNN